MSKLSEEYLKIIKDIEEHISDKEERNYVISKMSDISSLYMDIIDRITDVNSKRMENLEKHKKDIYEDDDYDFEIVCPYCNHEFVADVEDELKEEITCPECHNIIELDWDGDDEEDGCSGCCSTCHGHDGCDEEDDHDNKGKNDEKKDEDDDM